MLILQQSVPITTKFVSLNPVHGEVYSIQHCVIKFHQWLAIRLWFSPGTPVFSTYKTDSNDITNIVESGIKHHTSLHPYPQVSLEYLKHGFILHIFTMFTRLTLKCVLIYQKLFSTKGF